MLLLIWGALLCWSDFLNCRYVNMTQDLQRVDLLELSENEKLAFFLNLYNAIVIHAMIRVGCQEGEINRKSFSDFQYLIGGHPYSLATITNGILRSNRRSPYSLVKPFGTKDRRLEVSFCFSILNFGQICYLMSRPKDFEKHCCLILFVCMHDLFAFTKFKTNSK